MNSRRLWNSHQRHKFLMAEACKDILKFRVSEIVFPGVFKKHFPPQTPSRYIEIHTRLGTTQSKCPRCSTTSHCHGVFVLHFVTRDIFGLTSRQSRLEHVIMWHFELSSFLIEYRLLMTVHLERIVILSKTNVRFWSPNVLASVSVLKPITVGVLLVSNKIYHTHGSNVSQI